MGMLITSVSRSRQAFALFELVLVAVMISLIVSLSLQSMQPPGKTARQRACDVMRQTLQEHADRHFIQTAKWPSQNLSELKSPAYAGDRLMECPRQGGPYRMSGAIVICPAHEPTRQ